jgi:hypothetical protein
MNTASMFTKLEILLHLLFYFVNEQIRKYKYNIIIIDLQAME